MRALYYICDHLITNAIRRQFAGPPKLKAGPFRHAEIVKSEGFGLFDRQIDVCEFGLYKGTEFYGLEAEHKEAFQWI